MIPRADALQALAEALQEGPVAALLGPRQYGKTTPARSIARDGVADRAELPARFLILGSAAPRLVRRIS